jgi:hypothetical protein
MHKKFVEKEVMENIQNYRQPMVTATGIFLGFMLSFAASWVGNAFTKHMFRDYIVAISVILSITLLLVVLYRMLNMNYPADKVNTYYQQALRLFQTAVSIPFVAFVLIVIRILATHSIQQ